MTNETLEEAAANYANQELNNELTSKVGNFYSFSSSFIDGANYQAEKMYSEEEVMHIVSEALQSALVTVDLEQWFKQFKKK
jgi:hypothetical protein